MPPSFFWELRHEPRAKESQGDNELPNFFSRTELSLVMRRNLLCLRGPLITGEVRTAGSRTYVAGGVARPHFAPRTELFSAELVKNSAVVIVVVPVIMGERP